MISHSILQRQARATVVLVTGDRKWKNAFAVARELGMCTSMKILVHGDADGADTIAGEIGSILIGGRNVRPYPANWAKFKRAAGPIRNREMQKKEKPQFVLAFHSDLGNSKGTADMVQVARKAGIPVKVVAS